MTLALTERDHALIHAAWSLGLCTAATLRALVSPHTSAGTLRDRIRLLHRERYLTQVRYVAPKGALWLYGAGPKTRRPHERPGWKPSLAQVEHTLAVSEAIVALTRPGFAAPLVITGWQGEAEIRAWADRGEPYPDARITWQHDTKLGAWLVEVDRSTESRAAWRRKLARYLTRPSPDLILVLTKTRHRAANIAALASDVGLPAMTTSLPSAITETDPTVFDSAGRRTVPLSETCAPGGIGHHD